MKRAITCLLLLMAMALPMGSAFAAGSGVIQVTETYTADSADETYDAAKSITRGGKTYKLKNTKYTVLREPGDISKEEEVTGLAEKAVDKTKVYQIDGEALTLTLNEEKTTYEEAAGEERQYVYTTRDPESFTADSTRSFTVNGSTVTGTLKSTVKSKTYSISATFPGTFTGTENSTYFYFTGSGKLWPLNTAAPTWKGYETDILSYLGYSANTYTITGAKWTGSSTSNGKVTKTASFTVSREVSDYTATYAISGATLSGYTAHAVYENTDYEIEALMSYRAEEADEGLSTLEKVLLAGGAILVAAGAVASILYFLKKKRKQEEGEEGE